MTGTYLDRIERARSAGSRLLDLSELGAQGLPAKMPALPVPLVGLPYGSLPPDPTSPALVLPMPEPAPAEPPPLPNRPSPMMLFSPRLAMAFFQTRMRTLMPASAFSRKSSPRRFPPGGFRRMLGSKPQVMISMLCVAFSMASCSAPKARSPLISAVTALPRHAE